MLLLLCRLSLSRFYLNRSPVIEAEIIGDWSRKQISQHRAGSHSTQR